MRREGNGEAPQDPDVRPAGRLRRTFRLDEVADLLSANYTHTAWRHSRMGRPLTD